MVHTIRTIDAHAAGEPLRLVVDGLPSPEGKTMLEKRAWAEKRLDHFRRAIMLEPRGHADMYGALLTEPVTPDGHAGVLFMHNEGWSTMCGHGIVAVTTMALERGLIGPDLDEIRFDAPAGRVVARATRGPGPPVATGVVGQLRQRAVVRARSRPAGDRRRPHHAGGHRLRRRVLRHRRRRSRGHSGAAGAPAGTARARDEHRPRGGAAAARGPPGRRRA